MGVRNQQLTHGCKKSTTSVMIITMNYNFMKHSLCTALALQVHKNTQKISLMYCFLKDLSHTYQTQETENKT